MESNGDLVIAGGRSAAHSAAVVEHVYRAIGCGIGVLVAMNRQNGVVRLQVLIDAYRRRGIHVADVVHIRCRSDVFDPTLLRRVAHADLLLLATDDALALPAVLGASPLWTAAGALRDGGGVCLGYGAAGAAFGAHMLVDTLLSAGTRHGPIHLPPGLAALPRSILAVGAAASGRVPTLVQAVEQHPGMHAIGMDDQAALVVHGSLLTVLGNSPVSVVAEIPIATGAWDQAGGGPAALPRSLVVQQVESAEQVILRKAGAFRGHDVVNVLLQPPREDGGCMN